MKRTIITAIAALITPASALTEAQVFNIMKTSIANDEFAFDAGLTRQIIVDITPKMVKKQWTLKHEMPSKPDRDGDVFYYGRMLFKPGVFQKEREAMARITPTGILISWLIPSQVNADGSMRWSPGLTSQAPIDRYNRYFAELAAEKRKKAIEKEEAERKARMAAAEEKRKADEAAAKAKLAELKANAKPLTEKQSVAVKLALKAVYKRHDLVLDYIPGTLKAEELVADIERWTITTYERGKTKEITVEFDVELDESFGGIQTQITVTKVKVIR